MKKYTLVFLFNFDLSEIILQFKTRGTHPNKWCVPGGKIEIGETPYIGAPREMFEETDLTKDDLAHLHNNLYALADIDFHLDNFKLYSFYGILKEGKTFNQKEDEELKWFKVYEVLHGFVNTVGSGELEFLIRLALKEIQYRKEKNSL